MAARFPFLLAAVAIAVVITLIVHVTSKPSASPSTHRPPQTQSSVSAPNTSPSASSPRASAPPIPVTQLGAPLLGVSAGWEVFGRGDGVVVRIELARGRITRTTVPTLSSSGPVYFVVGKDEAIVRPLDFVPGYLVPDGHPARQLPATLSLGQGGPLFPGPDLNHVWVLSAGGGPSDIELTELGKATSGPLLPVPAGASVQEATPDGVGYLLFHRPGGTYDSRPDGLHRVTTGEVTAVGPTRWLVRECDSQHGCKIVVIDQASGERHVLTTRLGNANVLPGVISPDGSTAALVVVSASPLIEFIDLSTGVENSLSLRINQSAVEHGESLAWSPDSRWLFATNANSHLYAVNAHTGQITDLDGAHLNLPRPAH